VKSWSEEILALSSIVQTHPHSAYGAFVHGVIPKWNYVMHTTESVGLLLQPLEDTIHQHFIPALTRALLQAGKGAAFFAMSAWWFEYPQSYCNK